MKMSDETKVEEVQGAQGRRKFLKSAAQVAITAPAAVILLNATTIRPAAAAYVDATTAAGLADEHPVNDACFPGFGSSPDSLPQHPIDCP
jgi:hypothetical protein